MVKVSIEVRAGAARFKVAVRAESIQRAVNLVGGLYPGTDVVVELPLDFADFFVEDFAAAVAMVAAELPDQMAA